MTLLSLRTGSLYQDVDERLIDDDLKALIERCALEQRRAAAEVVRSYQRYDEREVSAEALAGLLDSGTDVRGIATEREITNAIPFNPKHVRGAVRDSGVVRLRRAIDARIARRIGALFVREEDPIVTWAGQYWYPPGSFMGWHTNSRFPGWRLYVTHCPEEGKSYFRYRDPDTGDVVTSVDRRWHGRLFKVSAEHRFWHCVYSQTDRFSIGYIVRPWSFRDAVIRRVRWMLAPDTR